MIEAAHIVSIEGSRDGVRFGMVRFATGQARRFSADLLNGTVRLWAGDALSMRLEVDPDLFRVAAATQALAELLRNKTPRREGVGGGHERPNRRPRRTPS